MMGDDGFATRRPPVPGAGAPRSSRLLASSATIIDRMARTTLTARTRPTSRARRRLVAATGVCTLGLFLSLTAKLFVWPALDPVEGTSADAVLVLGGPGPRLAVAAALARRHAAPWMLVSVPSVKWNCPHFGVEGVRVVCFRPDPFSTQGEARYFGEQAQLHGWRSVVVVSSVAQATRARLRVRRCFPGTVKVVGAPLSPVVFAYGVVYEWGALAKALLWQTGC